MNVREKLQNKVNSFCNFIDKLSVEINDESIKRWSNQLRNTSLTDFIIFVKGIDSLYGVNDLNRLIFEKSKEYNFDINKITDQNKLKFKTYFEFFIEMSRCF